eukprot:COSAG02_NODE_466_length_21773_cov_71.190966_9_plen_69_part_00
MCAGAWVDARAVERDEVHAAVKALGKDEVASHGGARVCTLYPLYSRSRSKYSRRQPRGRPGGGRRSKF